MHLANDAVNIGFTGEDMELCTSTRRDLARSHLPRPYGKFSGEDNLLLDSARAVLRA
jgi:hypothetical protein